MKDPKERLTDAEAIMNHDFFAGVKWDLMSAREVETPYVPVLQDPTDTVHFDKAQTNIPIYSPPKKGTISLFGDESDEFEDWHMSPAAGSSI